MPEISSEECCNPNFPYPEERNLHDLEERNLSEIRKRNLPNSQESNLPDPEERNLHCPAEDNLPVEQRSDIPEREVNSILCPAQATSERGEDVGVIGQTVAETEIRCLRRSTRNMKATQKLTYPDLGNPLVTIVQSLFQSLNEALEKSLVQLNYPEPCRVKAV